MKKIMSLVNIRPDIIRMSEIIKKLDKLGNIQHILVNSNQHYQKNLSGVFFEELEIREPDFNLNIGGPDKDHVDQVCDLGKKLVYLAAHEEPDLILYLGDCNAVCSSIFLKKEGFKIGHIEAGMRSRDNRMLEETNRKICDHCSDIHFVYHDNYKNNLMQEGISDANIHVVGNTIVEVVNNFCEKRGDRYKTRPSRNYILVDIHRPENFKYPKRIKNLFDYLKEFSRTYQVPVKFIKFPRTIKSFAANNIVLPPEFEQLDLVPYGECLDLQYHAAFIVSDSGSAAEEAPLLGVDVVVPRDFTERPESYQYNCATPLNLNKFSEYEFNNILKWLNRGADEQRNLKWLGDGNSASLIAEILNGNY